MEIYSYPFWYDNNLTQQLSKSQAKQGKVLLSPKEKSKCFFCKKKTHMKKNYPLVLQLAWEKKLNQSYLFIMSLIFIYNICEIDYMLN
jgi:hypothetical protein